MQPIAWLGEELTKMTSWKLGTNTYKHSIWVMKSGRVGQKASFEDS